MKRTRYLFSIAVVLISIFLFTGASLAENGGTYNWSGWYIGLNVGGSSMDVKQTNTADATRWGDMIPGQNFHTTTSGIISGGQIGGNVQVKHLVFGLESTAAWTSLEAKYLSPFGAADDVFKTRIDLLVSATARVGFAVNKFLLYAKGGYAGALANLRVDDYVPPNMGTGKATPWLSGWTVGGGAEYAITNHLITGIDYSYINLSDISVNYGGSTGVYSFDAKIKNFHQVEAKLCYKFNWW